MNTFASAPPNPSIGMCYRLWSPHRDSERVRAFRSTLAFRGEKWVWVDTPDAATWQILDAGGADFSSWHAQLTQAPTRRIQPFLFVLGAAAERIEDNLAKLTTPLNFLSIQNAINAFLARASIRHRLAGQKLKLKRWPNLSLYSDKKSVADSIALTMVCSELLYDHPSYEDITRDPQIQVKLHQLLSDALAEDNLVVGEVVIAPVAAPQPVRLGAFGSGLFKRLAGYWSSKKQRAANHNDSERGSLAAA